MTVVLVEVVLHGAQTLLLYLLHGCAGLRGGMMCQYGISIHGCHKFVLGLIQKETFIFYRVVCRCESYTIDFMVQMDETSRLYAFQSVKDLLTVILYGVVLQLKTTICS